MSKRRSDQRILIDIALKYGVKPRATVFDRDWSLLELDYSFLNFSELPPDIGFLNHLRILNLTGNLLSTLPPEIGQLTKLTKLYLAGNQLEILPPELGNLTNLQVLDLGRHESGKVYDSDYYNYRYGDREGVHAYGYNVSHDEEDDDDDEDDDEDGYEAENDDEDDSDDVGVHAYGNRFYEYDEDDEDEDDDEGDYDYEYDDEDDYQAPLEGKGNNISVLPPEIGRLGNLIVLDLTSNGLRGLPTEIGLLKKLRVLRLAYNQLTEIPVEVCHLTQLEELYLHSNQLGKLPAEIALLADLNTLLLDANDLIQVPLGIGRLRELKDLSIRGNPSLVVPPPEIADLPTSKILEYLNELERDSVTRYEAKMLLVGEGGTGKSSLLRSLRGDRNDLPLSTTHGIEVGKYEIADPTNEANVITLNTWDFGGQQIYHATHQFFLTHRSLYLVVWNARLGADQGRLNYWLDTIKALAPDSPVLLVATHIDERAPDLNYQLYKDAYPQVVGSVSVSNITGAGFDELKEQVASIASRLPLMGQLWPGTWIAAEERILSLPAHHVSVTEYVRQCDLSGVPVPVAGGTLGEFLHDLGKILFFRDDYILRNLIVLKPNWVTKAISQVLTDEEISASRGILSHSELPRIWREDEYGNTYDPYLYPVFLRLMERFDLSYQIEADTPGDHPTRSLIPQLLPHEPPVKLPPWPIIPPLGESMVEMLYKLDFVPAGIMSWFIVRTHPYTQGLHWREGVLLEYEGHQARVELNPMLRELRIVAWGPQPHNFFTILMYTADLILSRFEGLRITRGVPCICHWGQEVAGRCPRYYPYEDLVRRIQVRKNTVECPGSFKDVPVPTLLYGIHASTDDQVIADISRGYDEIQKKLDGLRKLEEQMLERLAQHSELIGRNFARQWNLEMQKLEAECPNAFWLTTHGRGAFNPKDWASQQYRLYLLCQHPPAPHTVGEGYTLRQSLEWWLTVSPWLNQLVKFVKFGVPMGKAVGAVYDEAAFEKAKAHAELMEEMTKAIPQVAASSESAPHGTSRPGLGEDQQAVGAALRALYHFLNRADPSHIWGGLGKVVTPDGNILWLCAEHRQQYEARPLVLEPASY